MLGRESQDENNKSAEWDSGSPLYGAERALWNCQLQPVQGTQSLDKELGC